MRARRRHRHPSPATISGPPHEEAEILDRPGVPRVVVERSLRELERVNRLLLGDWPVQRTLLPRLAAGPAHQVVLDLGTGSGDVARHLADAAARRGIDLTIVGIDRKLAHLVIGRRRGHRQLRVVADAHHLPVADDAVDWSFSTLFFHHFNGPENLAIVAEMRRVARRGAAVVDLRRSFWGRWLGVALVALSGAGAVTRHDGRISLARAWSLAAVARLTAGLPVRELRRRFPFRFALVVAPRLSAADPEPPATGPDRPPHGPR